jgi:hypothetical protein
MRRKEAGEGRAGGASPNNQEIGLDDIVIHCDVRELGERFKV